LRLYHQSFVHQSFTIERQYPPRPRPTILRAAASHDSSVAHWNLRRQQCNTAGGFWGNRAGACKRSGARSRSKHTSIVCAQDREVVAWKLYAQYRDPRTLARVWTIDL